MCRYWTCETKVNLWYCGIVDDQKIIKNLWNIFRYTTCSNKSLSNVRCSVRFVGKTTIKSTFLTIKPTRCTKFILDWNFTCFGQFLCQPSGIFQCTYNNGICHTSLLTACRRDAGPAFRLSANLYDINHCCMYNEKFLMIDRGTVRNM
jgi:hypothetical protein